jgi:hypothetical protein
MVADKTDERQPKGQMLIDARAVSRVSTRPPPSSPRAAFSNAAIAAMLVATEATVARHIRNIFDQDACSRSARRMCRADFAT